MAKDANTSEQEEPKGYAGKKERKLNRTEQQSCDKCEIRGLRESNEILRAHIGNLNTDLELIGLKRDVACLRSTVDGKNVELSKLQCAEKELKEHLERDLAYLREENKQLKVGSLL
uniref:uncharacterized protein LOC122599347 n=1 Tax=Erigeron canadensis TaxID=72917 RepID=UPI001CB9BA9F|nr:uncharacterized protein LOC122599347 [Erigeron canadensis]